MESPAISSRVLSALPSLYPLRRLLNGRREGDGKGWDGILMPSEEGGLQVQTSISKSEERISAAFTKQFCALIQKEYLEKLGRQKLVAANVELKDNTLIGQLKMIAASERLILSVCDYFLEEVDKLGESVKAGMSLDLVPVDAAFQRKRDLICYKDVGVVAVQSKGAFSDRISIGDGLMILGKTKRKELQALLQKSIDDKSITLEKITSKDLFIFSRSILMESEGPLCFPNLGSLVGSSSVVSADAKNSNKEIRIYKCRECARSYCYSVKLPRKNGESNSENALRKIWVGKNSAEERAKLTGWEFLDVPGMVIEAEVECRLMITKDNSGSVRVGVDTLMISHRILYPDVLCGVPD